MQSGGHKIGRQQKPETRPTANPRPRVDLDASEGRRDMQAVWIGDGGVPEHKGSQGTLNVCFLN